jgi:hypothetical protein
MKISGWVQWFLPYFYRLSDNLLIINIVFNLRGQVNILRGKIGP